MASEADVRRFAEANSQIRTLALKDLSAVWAQIVTEDPNVLRDRLIVVMGELVAKWGEVAATVAADYYEQLREQSIGGIYQADLAATVKAPRIDAATRWALGPVFQRTPDPTDALSRAGQVVDRMSIEQGNRTIYQNVRADPAKPRFARVPHGSTCAWCLILASRGAVYRTDESAAHSHAKCDCRPTPFWDGDPYPDHYDPAALYALYEQAAAKAGSGRIDKIAAAMRELSVAA